MPDQSENSYSKKNLSEIEKLERKFAEAVSLFNITTNAIREGILVVGSNNNEIKYFNRKFLKIWRIPDFVTSSATDEELIRFVIKQVKHPVKFLRKIKKLYSEPLSESMDIIQLNDGRILERLSVPQMLNEEPVGRIWSFMDVTDQRAAEEKLIAERDLLQALMDNIPDTIFFKDAELKFTRINKAHAKLLGVEYPEQALGRTDFDFFDEEFAGITFNDEIEIINQKKNIIAVIEKINKKQDSIWMSTTKVPIIDKFGKVTGIVGISRNITNSKIAEEKLKELNRSKDRLFSIIAHDLRSPFTPLLNLSEILVKDFDKLKREELRDFITDIYNSMKKQYDLLENLLNWSRIETGKFNYKPVKLNLYDQVDKVINLLSGNARDKNIALRNYTERSVYIFADKNMLHSIIQNLLSNAIKFSNNRGIVTVNSEELDSDVKIIVTDNGVGIKKEDLNKIFGPEHFTCFGTNYEKGTGLGLLICKEMVEKHGGKIWIESESRKGSSFLFTMPKLGKK